MPRHPAPSWPGSYTSAKLYYLHTDHLDTPRLVTDETNKVVWRNTPLSEPFGIAPVDEDPDGDGVKFVLNLRFPGQYFDQETNTSYNGFRDYDPSTGRYIQSDPIGLQGGINGYGYVDGQPLRYVDPTGESLAIVGGVLGLGVGIAIANGWNPLGSLMSGKKSNNDPFDGAAGQGFEIVPTIATQESGGCGKWMCEGAGQYDKVGTQKEVTQMGWFTAYGNTEADATYNWKKLVQAAAPRGYNARHIRPKRCKKIG